MHIHLFTFLFLLKVNFYITINLLKLHGFDTSFSISFSNFIFRSSFPLVPSDNVENESLELSRLIISDV